ncbi:MAG: cob(I)yrinic acid a,c-diamide adenosyltransferase [Candidatus Magasanikiibacteriota bacterium]
MKTTFFTGVGDGGVSNTGKKQYPKDDPIFMLLGSLDECTSWLGLARVTAKPDKKLKNTGEWLLELQEMLFVAQAEVATIAFEYGKYEDTIRKFPHIKDLHIKKCESMIEHMDRELPALKNFILPGGCELSAQCDIARTIARKAERYAVITSRTLVYSPELLAFLNRLSSVLFALARYANFQKGITEENPTY